MESLHIISINKREHRCYIHSLIADFITDEFNPDYNNCDSFLSKSQNLFNPDMVYEKYEYSNIQDLGYLNKNIAFRLIDWRKKIEHYSCAARIFIRFGFADEVISCFNQSLSLKETNNPNDLLEIAKTCIDIGSTYNSLKNGTESKKYLDKAVKLLDAIEDASKFEMLMAYEAISNSLLLEWKFNDALEYKTKALALLNLFYPEMNELKATIYNNMSIAYLGLGKYSDACTYATKALELWNETLPTEHPDIAYAYCNIGEALANSNSYDEAIKFLNKALKLRLNSLPDSNPEVSHSYNVTIATYIRNRKYHEAIELQKEYTKITENLYGNLHWNTMNCHFKLGMYYSDNGNYQKAFRSFRTAIDIGNQLLESNHPFFVSAYYELGSSLGRFRNDKKAYHYLYTALQLGETLFNDNHPIIADIHLVLAQLFSEVGNIPETILHYKKVVEIRERLFPDSEDQLLRLYTDIGIFFMHLGDHSTAEKWFQNVETIGCTKEAHIEPYATAIINLASYCGLRNEYYKSISYCNHILDKMPDDNKYGHFRLRILYAKGTALYSLKKGNEALLELKKAEEYKNYYPNNHLIIGFLYGALMNTYKLVGNKQESKKYEAMMNFFFANSNNIVYDDEAYLLQK